MAKPTIHALVVRNPGCHQTVEVLRTVVAAERPKDAARLSATVDIRTLLSHVHAALNEKRGERVNEAFLVHPRPKFAEVPGKTIDGRSCELPLALASLADLHARKPKHPVLCTGQVGPDGRVEPVSCLEDKIQGALEWLENRRGPERDQALIVVPAQLHGGGPTSELIARHKEEAASVSATLLGVRTLAEAASGCFGFDFYAAPGALGQQIGELRGQLWRALYATNYAQTLCGAERLILAVASESPNAPIRSMLEREGKVIARWAAGRLGAQVPVTWLGAELTAKQLVAVLDIELAKTERGSPGSDSVELQALTYNLDASAELRASTHMQRALESIEKGLSLSGLVDSPEGERRKLIGTRAQVRQVVALRARALGAEADAAVHLDFAVADAEQALIWAEAPGVEDCNDRARVRVYLASSLVCRGTDADVGQALHHLRDILGLGADLGAVATPHQAPGWALRVLYLLLRDRGPGSVLRHWLETGSRLKDPDNAQPLLGAAMTARLECGSQPQAYDSAIAAQVVADALAVGDQATARQMARFAPQDQVTLRSLAWWWPALQATELQGRPALQQLRTALERDELLRPPGPSRDPVVDELLGQLRCGDPTKSWQAWRRLSLWAGDPVPPTVSVVDVANEAMGAPLPLPQRVHLHKGATILFAELPQRSVALDGYVVGPWVDAENRRYSFDHHGGCVRHATLSTCEMVFDALRVGLDPRDLDIHVNDLDSDSILATWLLLRPNAVANAGVESAVHKAGRLDALGPAAAGAGLVPSLSWALAPLPDDPSVLRAASLATWRATLADCVQRLDRWLALGGLASHPEMRAPKNRGSAARVIHQGDGWQMVDGDWQLGLAAIYESGHMAGVAHASLEDGTHGYTIGKASEFVGGFDVPKILTHLAEAELAFNPAQDPAFTWGGGSTIGGSPRNADGSGSRLDAGQVVAVIETSLAQQIDLSEMTPGSSP